MKRLMPFLLLSLLVLACESDVDRNTSFVQAEIDGGLFRSNTQMLMVEEDGFTLQASKVDVLNFKLASINPGIYEVGPGSDNQVTLQRDGQLYVSNGPETGGVIEIESADSLSVSGNFNFDLRLNGVGELISVNKGVFYDVPLTTASTSEDEIDDDLPGDLNLPEESNISATNYIEANVNSEAYAAGIAVAVYNPDFNQLAIIGTQEDLTENIQMNFIAPINETGTYNFMEDNSPSYAIYDPNTFGQNTGENFEDVFSESGSVTIDSFDENGVSGTFEFSTVGGDVITEGEFEISELQIGND